MSQKEAMQTISEALKEMEAFLVPEYIANALAAIVQVEADAEKRQQRIDNLRESLIVADARMTKQLSGTLMSVTLIGYLSLIQQDIRSAIKADNGCEA